MEVLEAWIESAEDERFIVIGASKKGKGLTARAVVGPLPGGVYASSGFHEGMEDAIEELESELASEAGGVLSASGDDDDEDEDDDDEDEDD